MAKTKPQAAIYTRISDARDGDTAGVDRQLEDCLALCKAQGYEVVETFVDNNRSAYRAGGKRPAYDRMMQAVEQDAVDVIVVYSADRLYRRLADLESLAERLKAHKVFVRSVMSGDVNLGTADGLMQAGMLAVVAKHESQKRGERIARAALQRAEHGKFGGGGRRFGYNRDCTELVPDEADALRFAYETVAAGGSVRSVWREWTRRGLKGPNGGTLLASQIPTMLRRPMNAGLASYKGELLPGKSKAPAVIDLETWHTVQAILADPARIKNLKGRQAKALVAGMMRCGVCQDKVYRHYRGRKDRVDRSAYACASKKCTTRKESLVDDFIVGLLAEWLAKNAAKITRPKSRSKAKQALDISGQAEQLRVKLDDLTLLLAAGDLSATDYARGTRELRSRLDVLESQVAQETGLAAVRELSKDDDVRQAWLDLDTAGKRDVIGELLATGAIEQITLMPVARDEVGTPGVEVKWGKL